MFKPVGTVTGVYREDYGYNATAAAFAHYCAHYCDIWRQCQGRLTTLTGNTDDRYVSRIVGKKKGVS